MVLGLLAGCAGMEGTLSSGAAAVTCLSGDWPCADHVDLIDRSAKRGNGAAAVFVVQIAGRWLADR